MADLAGAGATLPKTPLQRLKDLEAAVAALRSSRGTVARAEFPAGIIPLSALQEATSEPGLVNLTLTNFTVPTTATTLLSASITVPAGFTSCVVNLVGRVFAINTTGADGYLTAQVNVAGVTGNAVPVYGAGSGGDDAAFNVATFATALAGLVPGTSFAVHLDAWADAAWAADPSNLADLTGSIVWFV